MSDTIGAALKAVRTQLATIQEDALADREARLILAHATGLSQATLVSATCDPLPEGATAQIDTAVASRLARQPLSQILGQVEFFGRTFRVTPDVLTPRPDTETLVDMALSEPFTRVLDLGTGSGCILATLLSERPGTTGIGTDISEPALEVAKANGAALGLNSQMELVRSNWSDRVEGDFDLIVSNPPYITFDEMETLAPEVRTWEPRLALTPGGDGLDAYRSLTKSAPAILRPGGRLLVEIGVTQGSAVVGLFSEAGLEDCGIHPDLTGRPRVVAGRRA